MTETKSFGISKRAVWEAYRREKRRPVVRLIGRLVHLPAE